MLSCDMQDMSIQSELLRALPPKNSDYEVVLLSGNSHDPDFRQQVKQELHGVQVDLLFIDGDHTEQGVEADIVTTTTCYDREVLSPFIILSKTSRSTSIRSIASGSA